MSESNKPNGLNVLCIDGGGVRGLSSLILLDEITKRLRGGDDTMSQHPCDYFDVIAGTGTGGVIACMLGRLQMTVEDAIKAYDKLSSTAFGEQKLGIGRAAYKGTKLQEALKTMVRDKTQNENEAMKAEDEGGSKTMVFAMSERNMTATIPTMFRSYPVVANSGPDCTIWEALYATMAHPDLFKPIQISDGTVRQSFVGGDVGCSNPMTHVLAEVKRLHPDRHVSCVLQRFAIRFAKRRIFLIEDSSIWPRILGTRTMKAMKDMATDSERVAQETVARFRGTPGVYYRLNVDQGMQEIQAGEMRKLGDIVAHTKAYTGKQEASQTIDQAVETIKSRASLVATTHIDGQVNAASTPRVPSIKRCPAPTSVYTGREDELKRVGNCISGCTSERRVCVVYGLGGAGKTQLALKTVEKCRDSWVHVLYIDASTKNVIEITLQDYAKVKKLGDTYEDTLSWLERCKDPWLVVFDNADDPSLDIKLYFPGSNHGSILITTRLRDLDMYAKGPDSVCHVSSMNETDALALLLKLARRQEQELNEAETTAATLLLRDFGWLALAVIHAGAYIGHSRSLSISKYRELYLEQRQSLLERYGDLKVKPDSYDKSVQTTWEMCYNLLAESGKSRPLLWLIAFLHHDRITEAMFKQAAINLQTYRPDVPPSELEMAACNYVRSFLGNFLDSNGRWDSLLFSEVMGELVSYSLVEFDEVNLSYSMHVLVQEWCRNTIIQTQDLALESATTLVARSVAWGNSAESYSFNRGLGVHVSNVLSMRRSQTGANHGARFARVYDSTGKWQEKGIMELQVKAESERLLGKEHPYTLQTIDCLASTYQSQGRWTEAESLKLQVMDAYKRLLGEEHPDTLTTMHNLASTYSSQGRWTEAESLQLQVMNASKRLLGEEHPSRLSTMHNLASTYQSQGRWTEAESLQLQVMNASKRLLGEEHPNTLSTMHELASTYLSQGRWTEAESLQLQVMNTRKRLLGEEHPDTLSTMHNLASTYQSQGRWTEAESLQLQVVNASKRLLGEEHPDTLTTTHELASTYSTQGRLTEAESLQLQVMDAYKRLLGEEHPDTLTTMHNLASTYSSQGRWTEAESLQLQVMNTRKRLLGEEHPSRLSTMHNLASTYQSQGRWTEAESLQLQVMKASKRLLGEEHPDTLTTMHELASTYQSQGRWTEAESLQLQVVNARKRLLGEEHPDTLATMHNLASTYSSQGRWTEAELLLKHVVNARKRVLGGEHPYTLNSVQALESICQRQLNQG